MVTFASDVESEISEAFARWRAAVQSGNPKKVVALYKEGATLLATLEKKPIRSKKEKLKYFTKLCSNPNLEVIVIEEHIKVLDGNHAIINGLYAFQYGTETIKRIDARFNFVFEKDKDQWLIIDHHSSTLPVH
jgi:uncharacterized protein (TIGR02246 family)